MTNGHWAPYMFRFLGDPNWTNSDAINAALASAGVEIARREYWASAIQMRLADLSIELHAEEKPKPAQLIKELAYFEARLRTAISAFHSLSPAAKVELFAAAEQIPLWKSENEGSAGDLGVHYANHMMEVLHQWCEQALRAAPAVRAGRGKRDALFRFAVAIGNIYEEATGRPATRVIRRDNEINSGGAFEAGEFRRFANSVLASTGQQVTDEMAKRAIAVLRNGEKPATAEP